MEKDEVLSRLRKVQENINVPKSCFNKFGKYYFRNAEAILAAATPLLVKECLTMVILDEMVEVGGRVYVCSKVIIEGIEMGTAYAREPVTQSGMAEPQCTGSASSYARKYALNGVFLLDDTADSDSMDNREEGKASVGGKIEKDQLDW